jgi:hypothetical protein
MVVNFRRNRPACYGSLNCPENYECPLTTPCGKAFFDELSSVPLEAWRMIQQRVYAEKMVRYCRDRVKTFAWEHQVKRKHGVESVSIGTNFFSVRQSPTKITRGGANPTKPKEPEK